MPTPLSKQISFHCFSGDGKQCAVSKNDDVVYLYDTNGKDTTEDWKETQVVTEHGGQVSGIDWCAKTNLIVTCGHDRNAYVWKYEADIKAWKPTLVILRINRAATCVKWSPNGDKFAVGSGAKCVPVCHFEESQNWWISKMIKKHKSSVLDLDWSPNQKYLVTGACDFKCRIFSAFIEGIDTKEDDKYTAMFGAKSSEFGECLMEFDQAKAWVQGVSWSPSGMRLAFAGHGSTLSFIHLSESGAPAVQTIYQKCLPTSRIAFVDDSNLLAIGFDYNPTVYGFGGSDASPEWKEKKKLDPETDGEKKKGGNAARNMFQDADTRGMTAGSAGEPEFKTFHKNNIVDLHMRGKGKFSTSGVDGRICQWTV